MNKIIKLTYYNISLKKISTLEFSSSRIKEKFKKESLFVLNLEGKSMQPLILDKSLLIVSLDYGEIIDKSLYIIEHEKNLWLKQADISNHKMRFISINKDFSHIIYEKEDIRIIAKVLLDLGLSPK